MKNYFKKVLLYAFIMILLGLFMNNIALFKGGHIITLTLDWGTQIIIIGTFLYSFVIILIIKLISLKMGEYFYSNKLIIYSAIAFESFAGFEILLFHDLFHHLIDFLYQNLIILYVIISIFISLIAIIVYYNWKYRIEIVSGLFIMNLVIRKTALGNLTKTDFLDAFFAEHLGIDPVSNFSKGMFLLGIYGIYLAIAIYLRKKGVYDRRSKKEKREEKDGQGYYARYNQSVETDEKID